jgi:MbtH protein
MSQGSATRCGGWVEPPLQARGLENRISLEHQQQSSLLLRHWLYHDNKKKGVAMSSTEEKYLAVINHEEQYAIWPSFKAVPLGWRSVFGPEVKDRCLQYITERWTDMRPKSLREKMMRG